MSLVYADTSAIVRAYFADEEDHDALRAMLLEGREPVVTSELCRVELASATRAASRARRMPELMSMLLPRFDVDCGPDGPLCLLRFRPEVLLPAAYRMVSEHKVRTLDALHLAAAMEDAGPVAGAGGLIFVTRDADQAEAARALGLTVR